MGKVVTHCYPYNRILPLRLCCMIPLLCNTKKSGEAKCRIFIRDVFSFPKIMNRLAVGRSARAQQAHKVNNRINWLMPLYS